MVLFIALPKQLLVIILSDITERKSTESNTLWLASFPELNPMPVMEIDYEYNITYKNPAASSIFSDARVRAINPNFFPSKSMTSSTCLRQVRIQDQIQRYPDWGYLAPP